MQKGEDVRIPWPYDEYASEKPTAMYDQIYVDGLNDEIRYWKKQCYNLQVKLRKANICQCKTK